MAVNYAMKQEESNPSYVGVYSINPYLSDPAGTPLDSWSFTTSASDTAYNTLQFQHTSTSSQSTREDTQTTAPFCNSNTDLSAVLRLNQTYDTLTPVIASLSQKPPRTHVPRPPNAFMLYRSDFLKRGIIPNHVERRQQNLSRIAGQCWNLLAPEEKALWQEKAAKVLMEHQTRNPDYKFTPAPRGSRRSRGKGRLDSDVDSVDGEERIRQIREEYARISGPTAPPTRRRRARVHNRCRNVDKGPVKESSPSPEPATAPIPPSEPPSPSLSSPGPTSIMETPLPPFFPQYTFPHIILPRRPSTSLGFSSGNDNTLQGDTYTRTGSHLPRPSSAASDTGLSGYLRDLDIAPSAPPPPVVPESPMPQLMYPTSCTYPAATPAHLEELTFPTLNTPYPSTSLFGGHSVPNESFFGSLYGNEPFGFGFPMPRSQQGYASLEDLYLFENYEPWDLETSFTGHMKSYTL